MAFSNNLKKYIISIFAVSAFIFSAQGFAGAFQLWEESAASLGDYHAGAAAEANDAGTIFYNPAGMTRIHRRQLSFGAVFIPIGVTFNGTTTINGVTLPTSAGVSSNTFGVVPNFHYLLPINQRLAFGLEETTPFGLSTNYVDSFSLIDAAGTLGSETKLETINLNPGLAYQFNQYISFGAGFDVMYGDAIYDSDYSYISGTSGSILSNSLSGWGCGYNAGILLQFTPETRMGLSYRSAITIDASGPSSYLGSTSTVSANFPLPATTMLSLYHDVTHRLALMASVFYTQWSCFHELLMYNMETPVPNVGNLALFENYHNTWNIALGGKYTLNHYVELEAGVGHDQTPTELPYRDIRSPDSNHYVSSIGVNIHAKKNIKLSVGWTHLFMNPTTVDNSGSVDPSRTSSDLVPLVSIGQGTVTSSVNVFGLQITWDI